MRLLACATFVGLALLGATASESCQEETFLFGEVVAFDHYAGVLQLTHSGVTIPIVLRVVANLKGPVTANYIVAQYVGPSGSEQKLELGTSDSQPVVLSLKICRAHPESISLVDLTTSEEIEDGKKLTIDPLEYVDLSSRKEWGERLPVFQFGPDDYEVLTVADLREYLGD